MDKYILKLLLKNWLLFPYLLKFQQLHCGLGTQQLIRLDEFQRCKNTVPKFPIYKAFFNLSKMCCQCDVYDLKLKIFHLPCFIPTFPSNWFGVIAWYSITQSLKSGQYCETLLNKWSTYLSFTFSQSYPPSNFSGTLNFRNFKLPLDEKGSAMISVLILQSSIGLRMSVPCSII